MGLSRKIRKGFELIISLPKSFYTSWRLTSFKKAFLLPVMVRYNVKLLNTTGNLWGGVNLE